MTWMPRYSRLAFVGISNGDVEGKVVGERVVGFGVTELGKRSIVDGEFRCSALGGDGYEFYGM